MDNSFDKTEPRARGTMREAKQGSDEEAKEEAEGEEKGGVKKGERMMMTVDRRGNTGMGSVAVKVFSSSLVVIMGAVVDKDNDKGEGAEAEVGETRGKNVSSLKGLVFCGLLLLLLLLLVVSASFKPDETEANNINSDKPFRAHDR
jgi:hypothetical protein